MRKSRTTSHLYRPEQPHLTLTRTAQVIRAELRRRGADFTSLRALYRALRVPEATIRAAIELDPGLGVCGRAEYPTVWSLPRAALVAGFEPELHKGHLVLRLPSLEHEPLIITGRRLGPVRHGEPDALGDGLGELGHTIVRLSAMARRWVVPQLPTTDNRLISRLMSLIARAWQRSPVPVWSAGPLEVHQADLDETIGVQFWADGAPTTRLELVVLIGQHGAELVNVYPAGQHSAIFQAGG